MGLYAGFCAYSKRYQESFGLLHSFAVGVHGCCFRSWFARYSSVSPYDACFFKALMFLGSGSVIHACHHEQDIFAYGGLAQMPLTAYTFLVGVLAISGVHFLSGYFSKDAILLGAYNLDFVIFSILYLGAILTSVYMFRLYFLTFCGEARSKASSGAHESSIFMTGPLLVLAFLSIVGGFVAIYPNQIVAFLKPDIARGQICQTIYG